MVKLLLTDPMVNGSSYVLPMKFRLNISCIANVLIRKDRQKNSGGVVTSSLRARMLLDRQKALQCSKIYLRILGKRQVN